MHIAVIGGGITGILSIAMLKEEGFSPVCFEKSDNVGGTWCYRDISNDGITSIMPTTVINNSKEMGALSNFPPRKQFSNYMRHSEMYRYILDYVEAKDVMRHVRLNTEVVAVKKAEDYEMTGKWTVQVRNTLTENSSTDIYDAVIVCSGQFNRPKIVTFPGQKKFKGKIMHTHTVKGVSDFKGQNVLVVGMGCSGLDAAVEISSVAKQVFLSTRSGTHVINRIGPYGYPIDYTLLRRYITQLLSYFPAWFCAWLLTKFYLDPKFDHRLYPVPPKDHLFSKDPIQNDHFASKLLSGSIVQKKNITCFTNNGVFFASDDYATAVDTVVMATGYILKFPFLEKSVVSAEEGKINLYKCVFPSHLPHPTLAFVGIFLTFGPGFPPAELQCRWLAHILAGKGKLPSERKMTADIDKKYRENIVRYTYDDKVNIRYDYTQYMDDLAQQIGVKPNWYKLMFTDPILLYKLWFGPCVSYQYRLNGDHKWDGAREAIMTVDERLHFPLGHKRK